MAEIFEFPRNKETTKPMNNIELTESIENFRMGYIDDITEFLLTILVGEIGRAGFELEHKDTNDIMLISESLRSFMMKKSGFEHPLQDIALDIENVVGYEPEEEQTTTT